MSQTKTSSAPPVAFVSLTDSERLKLCQLAEDFVEELSQHIPDILEPGWAQNLIINGFLTSVNQEHHEVVRAMVYFLPAPVPCAKHFVTGDAIYSGLIA